MKLFNVIFSFLEPVEGHVTIQAETPEEANDKTLELFRNRLETKIVNVYEISEEQQVPLPFLNEGDIEVI